MLMATKQPVLPMPALQHQTPLPHIILMRTTQSILPMPALQHYTPFHIMLLVMKQPVLPGQTLQRTELKEF